MRFVAPRVLSSSVSGVLLSCPQLFALFFYILVLCFAACFRSFQNLFVHYQIVDSRIVLSVVAQMFQGGTDDGSADDDVNLHIRSGGGGGGGGGAVAPAVTPQFGRGAATSVASGAARDASNYNRPLLSGSGASSSSHRYVTCRDRYVL